MSDSGIPRLVRCEDVYKAFTTAYINATPFGIYEYIISVPANVDAGKDRAVARTICDQLRRIAKNTKHSLPLVVDRHWEVGANVFYWKRVHNLTERKVYDGNLPGTGHVDEDFRAGTVELKTFRMRFELNFADLRPPDSINDRNGAVSITHVKLVRPLIDADIVGVVAKIYPCGRRKMFPLKQSDGTVPRIGYVKRVRRCDIADPLRFFEPRKSAQ